MQSLKQESSFFTTFEIASSHFYLVLSVTDMNEFFKIRVKEVIWFRIHYFGFLNSKSEGAVIKYKIGDVVWGFGVESPFWMYG